MNVIQKKKKHRCFTKLHRALSFFLWHNSEKFGGVPSIRDFWWLTRVQGSPKCFHNWARGLSCWFWHADYSASTMKHCNNTISGDAIKWDHVQRLHPTTHQTGTVISDQQTGSFFQVHPPCWLPWTKYYLPNVFSVKTSEPAFFQCEPRVWSVEEVHPKPTHLSLFFCGAPMRTAPRPGSGLPGGSLPPAPAPAPCPAPWTPRVGSPASLRSFSAGAQGGTGWGQGPALPGHLPLVLQVLRPVRAAVAETWPAYQAQGEGAATPGVVTFGPLPSLPSPQVAGTVYLRLCSSLFLFHFSFCWGVGTPWAQSALGNPRCLAPCRSPIEKGAGWPRPGLRCPQPPTLQPGLDGGTELRFSALGTGVLVERAIEFCQKSLRLGPLPTPVGPTRFPQQAAGRLPRPLMGNTWPQLQFSLALRAEVFHLLTLCISRALFSPSSTSRGAQIAGPPAHPAGSPARCPLRALPAAGEPPGGWLTARTCAWPPSPSCRFGRRRGLAAQSAEFLT